MQFGVELYAQVAGACGGAMFVAAMGVKGRVRNVRYVNTEESVGE